MCHLAQRELDESVTISFIYNDKMIITALGPKINLVDTAILFKIAND